MKISANVMDTHTPTIGLVIAHKGFRDEEYSIPQAIFRQSGFSTRTISTQLTPATSKFNKLENVDWLLSDPRIPELDAIVFVGGPGASDYFHDPVAHAVARHFFAAGKLTTAICIAPLTLAYAGVLTGRSATVFPSGKEELIAQGAHYLDVPVVQDGHIITGNGPQSAEAFARAVVAALTLPPSV